jgi:NAD(P) transhydrogenase subunit alpha
MSGRLIRRFGPALLVGGLGLMAAVNAAPGQESSLPTGVPATTAAHPAPPIDYWSLLFVFVLSTFIGLGIIRRVSRLLHTPLMSLTNAISAIAVVGAILVVGPEYPANIRILGAIALFASMTNIVSGFLITDRMLKMFKQDDGGKK